MRNGPRRPAQWQPGPRPIPRFAAAISRRRAEDEPALLDWGHGAAGQAVQSILAVPDAARCSVRQGGWPEEPLMPRRGWEPDKQIAASKSDVAAQAARHARMTQRDDG